MKIGRPGGAGGYSRGGGTGNTPGGAGYFPGGTGYSLLKPGHKETGLLSPSNFKSKSESKSSHEMLRAQRKTSERSKSFNAERTNRSFEQSGKGCEQAGGSSEQGGPFQTHNFFTAFLKPCITTLQTDLTNGEK